LNDVAFVDKLRYDRLSVSQVVDADLDVLFASLVREFLILLAILFVVFLTLAKSFKMIFLLLNLL
jgi:hypothetical protein